MDNHPSRNAQLRFQKDFSAAELRDRRARLMRSLGTGHAFLAGAGAVRGFDPFRQDNDFYYLTGVEVPHAYLLLDNAAGKETLYLPDRDAAREKADGPELSAQDADFVRQMAGLDEVRPLAALRQDLKKPEIFFTPRAFPEGYRQCQDTLRAWHRATGEDPLACQTTPQTHLLSELSQLNPQATFRNLSPVLEQHRLIKSPAEIELLRRSSALTALACTHAMMCTRPGLFEYHLAATADYIFGINGAQGAGYRPIIATGANIWMMHYWRNNALLQNGELVIFDYAPDFNGYTSDIGRMWPVNGVYSPVQRELYGFVLQYHDILLSLIRAGRSASQILAEAAAKMRPILEDWPWSKPVYKHGALKLLESRRPLSHGVGMAVHESGRYGDEPLKPGLVFAVDPELVIPEEELYIRVEDTVVVTDHGHENLTVSCPREMDEVEKLIGTSRLFEIAGPVMENPGR